MPRVHQISVSDGGVPKTAVDSARVGVQGLTGDRQRDNVNHGGPDKALCLYSLEVIERLQAEGHPIEAGFAGENLTITGLDWPSIVPGARLFIGTEIEIEITSYTTPCSHQRPWFNDGDFTRILQSRHPGESRVYARVLRGGTVNTGDDVRVVS
jgi:MOSC domain-containing protein YiiM